MRLKKILWTLFFTSLLANSASADTLGQNQRFFIDTQYEFRGRDTVNATLRALSQRAYGYIADNYWSTISENARALLLEQVNSLLDEFDARIYPLETAFFGAEPNPGIDQDPKTAILFTPLTANAGGYFNTGNLYPSSQNNPDSNAREMFYININALDDEQKSKSFLAHEFQHLVAFNQKEKLRGVTDDVWLNELRSEFAVSWLGYNEPFNGSSLEKRSQSFLSSSPDSLTEWKNLNPDYAQVALFGEYLSEHWPAAVISASLQSSLIGIPALNSALAESGAPETFLDIFQKWLIANILNDPSTDPKYAYTRDGLRNFRVAPTGAFTNLSDGSTLVYSESVKDWEPRWYEISQFASGQKNYLKIRFASPSLTSFRIAYIIFKTDGSKMISYFDPDFKNDSLTLSGISSDFSKIILMPIKHDKLAGFAADEMPVNLSFSLERIKTGVITPSPTSAPTPGANSQLPVINNQTPTRPADFGLREGDFIRAESDNNVYIINNFGYKRLVLNPQICLQYGHLGARGCFSAVKAVVPSVRDAFQTSWYFTNGETGDGKVYFLEQTGEDTARLRHLQISGADFVAQGGNFHSVFLFNTREQNTYPASAPHFKL